MLRKGYVLAILLITVSGITLFSLIASAEQDYNIPSWIKKNAVWWGEGKVSDSNFISGLQFLIDNNILKMSQERSVDDKYLVEYKDWAKGEISKFQDYSKQLKSNLNDMERENQRLDELSKYWEKRAKRAEAEAIEGSFKNRLDKASLEAELEAYKEYEKEVQEYFETESSKPQTLIDDQKVHWRVTDSKGNHYYWTMPVESYETLVMLAHPQVKHTLKNTNTDETYSILDYSYFVTHSFEDIIDEVYDNAKSDRDFAYEAWYIVSQLTTYSYDIGDNPRWALETLTRGGGDCEDTAILIASMLISSKHTEDWIIKFVYFDAYNPEKPQTVNHITIHIDDGNEKYFIESTSKDTPYKWDYVNGWYFEIDRDF